MEPYLLVTYHPATRAHSLNLADEHTCWLGLTIKRHETTGIVDGKETAIVEFVARYNAIA